MQISWRAATRSCSISFHLPAHRRAEKNRSSDSPFLLLLLHRASPDFEFARDHCFGVLSSPNLSDVTRAREMTAETTGPRVSYRENEISSRLIQLFVDFSRKKHNRPSIVVVRSLRDTYAHDTSCHWPRLERKRERVRKGEGEERES